VIQLLISAIASAISAFLAPYLPAPAAVAATATDVHLTLVTQLTTAALANKSDLGHINSAVTQLRTRVH
jgi:hypothetical protein